ncbi:DUF533 domain-containing protein [Arenimonas sp.]|uniref:DUF533 domain-containing protein n=1 Tax=Arenimonas sp. TaxID=1872635 RepID=UPI0039E43E51
MFDPEKMLGQIMGDAMSGALGGSRRKRKHRSGFLGGSGLGMAGKAKLGVGLLALAYAAYEHFKQQPATGTTGAGAPAAPAPVMGSQPPPPPPGLPPSPPPAQQSQQALHLVRAMICAANADGLIDAQEREALLGRAREAGMGREELDALDIEMRAPLTLQQLVVRTPAELRDETYAAALIAITADTDEENRFLEELAAQLQLDASAQRDIRQQLGL